MTIEKEFMEQYKSLIEACENYWVARYKMYFHPEEQFSCWDEKQKMYEEMQNLWPLFPKTD